MGLNNFRSTEGCNGGLRPNDGKMHAVAISVLPWTSED